MSVLFTTEPSTQPRHETGCLLYQETSGGFLKRSPLEKCPNDENRNSLSTGQLAKLQQGPKVQEKPPQRGAALEASQKEEAGLPAQASGSFLFPRTQSVGSPLAPAEPPPPPAHSLRSPEASVHFF